MPALLNIVMEHEIRDFARGKVDPGRVELVRNTIQSDQVAKRVFEQQLDAEKVERRKKVQKVQPVKLEKQEAKQGDNSRRTTNILLGSLGFALAIGFVSFVAINNLS